MCPSSTSNRRPLMACLAFSASLILGTLPGQLAADDKLDRNPDLILDVVELKKTDVNESSGLAASNLRTNHWWTHNDSGAKARLYAVNAQGKLTGRCKLKGIKADDWEDMAAFVQDGQPRLIIADCGDNLGKRKFITLHLFDEPDPTKKTDIKKVQSIEVTFPDRAHDCEAIGVDARRKKIILVTKSKLPFALVYEVALPKRMILSDDPPIRTVAKKIASVTLPMISGMDIDANNGDVWIVNYFQAFHYKRLGTDQTFADQFATLPRSYALPHWRQVEAIAVDSNHQVWITSEGKSPPLGRLKLAPPTNR